MDRAAVAPRSAWGWAMLVLRVVLGVTFLLHGSQKLFGAFGGPGLAGFAMGMEKMGLAPPMFWAALAACGEFFGGLLVLLGLAADVGAVLIACVMAVAIWKVHWAGGYFLPRGFEYNLLILAGCAVLILTGPGRLALWDPFAGRASARREPPEEVPTRREESV